MKKLLIFLLATIWSIGYTNASTKLVTLGKGFSLEEGKGPKFFYNHESCNVVYYLPNKWELLESSSGIKWREGIVGVERVTRPTAQYSFQFVPKLTRPEIQNQYEEALSLRLERLVQEEQSRVKRGELRKDETIYLNNCLHSGIEVKPLPILALNGALERQAELRFVEQSSVSFIKGAMDGLILEISLEENPLKSKGLVYKTLFEKNVFKQASAFINHIEFVEEAYAYMQVEARLMSKFEWKHWTERVCRWERHCRRKWGIIKSCRNHHRCWGIPKKAVVLQGMNSNNEILLINNGYTGDDYRKRDLLERLHDRFLMSNFTATLKRHTEDLVVYKMGKMVRSEKEFYQDSVRILDYKEEKAIAPLKVYGISTASGEEVKNFISSDLFKCMLKSGRDYLTQWDSCRVHKK